MGARGERCFKRARKLPSVRAPILFCQRLGRGPRPGVQRCCGCHVAFPDIVVGMNTNSAISARTLCTMCYWAGKAGMLGLANDYGLRPGMHTGKHAAALAGGKPGILHGMKTYFLQDDDGQIAETHSISAGLDYPGIGPEHALLHDIKRVEYAAATDSEALEAFKTVAKLEGILAALEPSHALAHVLKIAPKMKKDTLLVVNVCGRGDKDIFTIANALGMKI